MGELAPDFELRDQHGAPVRLSDRRGARNVVLVFYPFAFSGVCSAEMGALRDSFPEVSRPDVELMAVSADTVFSLRTWADAEGFSFALLSDFWPHGEVAREYGVFLDNKGFANRATFLIDIDGVIRASFITAPGQARSIEEYTEALRELHAARV